MKIRHTVIFTFYETTTAEQIDEVTSRLNDLGDYVTEHLGAVGWTVAKHISETTKPGRAHLLQDGVFPSVEALRAHALCGPHMQVVELTSKVCDWMTIDTGVTEGGGE